VKLFKKPDSSFYWYDFTVRGERFRGSTKESSQTRAAKIAGLKFAEAMEGTNPLPRKAPTLREFSQEFLKCPYSLKVVQMSAWRIKSLITGTGALVVPSHDR
jgi:hypothetical protein